MLSLNLGGIPCHVIPVNKVGIQWPTPKGLEYLETG